MKKKHGDITYISSIGYGGGGVFEEFCGKFFWDDEEEGLVGYFTSQHDPDEWETKTFEDEEVDEVLEVEPLPSNKGDEEVQLTEEEVEILVEETEEAIAKVITIEIVEEEPLDTEGLTEEEVFEAEEDENLKGDSIK